MKMLKICKSIVLASAFAAAMVGYSASSYASEETGKWDAAGKEIKEAAKAVGEASEESAYKAMDEAGKAWEVAKEKSRQSLEAAKKKYDQEMEAARVKIHEATAPKDEAAPEPEQHETTEKP